MKKTLLLLLFPLLTQAQSLDWQVTDVAFNQGDTVQADFYAHGFDSITCYQMAMQFDTAALDFVAVTFPAGNPMGLSLGCFSWHGKPGYNVQPNEIRQLRSMPHSKTFADGTHGFSYVFVAKQAATLSQKLSLSTCCLYPPLAPLSWRWILEQQSLTVSYAAPQQTSAATATDAPQVRIYPNPAVEHLTIECDAAMQVEIYSASGTLTHKQAVEHSATLPLDAGMNIVRISDGQTVIVKAVFRL